MRRLLVKSLLGTMVYNINLTPPAKQQLPLSNHRCLVIGPPMNHCAPYSSRSSRQLLHYTSFTRACVRVVYTGVLLVAQVEHWDVPINTSRTSVSLMSLKKKWAKALLLLLLLFALNAIYRFDESAAGPIPLHGGQDSSLVRLLPIWDA